MAELPAFVETPRENEIYHTDALTLLRAMPDASVDLVVTDPPYGIGYASSRTTREGGGARRTSGTFGRDEYDDTWLTDAVRVLKPGGALYVFTRWDVMHQWHAAIQQAGAKVVQRIVWHKAHWKMGDLRYYGSQTEDILFCRKGAHALRWSQREGNVWYCADAAYLDGGWNHPTQKPEALIERAIVNSSDPGDLVLDPFMGSGTTAVAARNTGRRFVGCDISHEYVTIARKRLQTTDPFQPTMHENGVTQMSLFSREVVAQ
jgi:DNA modification methylase